MWKNIRENHPEKVALAGIVCLMLGAGIFFGMTPRGAQPNAAGEAWPLALPFLAVGAFLLALHWYWNR